VCNFELPEIGQYKYCHLLLLFFLPQPVNVTANFLDRVTAEHGFISQLNNVTQHMNIYYMQIHAGEGCGQRQRRYDPA